MISAPLPWSTSTRFTSYPHILRVTTKASSFGCEVPTLSSSKKLKVGWTSILLLFRSGFKSSTNGRLIDITLDRKEPVLPKVVRITLIVPNGGLEEASLYVPDLAWPPCPLGWYRNCFNFPILTNCSRWLYKVLHSSVVCPRSWWYWQWRLWLRFVRSTPILFGHLKYGSFLIFSKT